MVLGCASMTSIEFNELKEARLEAISFFNAIGIELGFVHFGPHLHVRLLPMRRLQRQRQSNPVSVSAPAGGCFYFMFICVFVLIDSYFEGAMLPLIAVGSWPRVWSETLGVV